MPAKIRVAKPPAPLEWVEQAHFVRRVKSDHRTRGLLFTATANGLAARSKASAAKMIGQGLSKGVPDLLFFEPHPQHPLQGLAIEMKRRPNKPTPEQLDWLSGLEARGWACAVCYSSEEAWTVLCDYLGITPAAYPLATARAR